MSNAAATSHPGPSAVGPMLQGLAALFLVSTLVGRSGLPLNAQWGDILFPILAFAALLTLPLRGWLRREDIPLAAYLTVTLVTALLSVDPVIGFKHLLKQVYVAAIFTIFRALAQNTRLTLVLKGTFSAATTAVAALSILAMLSPFSSILKGLSLVDGHTIPVFGRVERLQGGLETPELFGNALLLAFVLVLGLRASAAGGRRFVWTASAVIVVAAEALTFSHSAAGFAVAAAIFWTPAWSRAARLVCWSGVAAIVLLVNAASIIDLSSSPEAADYSVRPVSINVMGTQVNGRLNHYAALKEVAWNSFREHPLTGVGPGRFMNETEKAFFEGRLTERYRYKVPQSDVAGRSAETGVLGLVSLLWLWASWLRGAVVTLRSAAPLQRAALCAVIGLLVNSLNADVMNFRFLWIAVAWAMPRPNDETAEA